MDSPSLQTRRPSRAITFLGALLGAAIGWVLFFLAGNEYLFPAVGRYFALALGLGVALTYRLTRRRSGHEVSWVVAALFAYSAHLSLGGYTYLGYFAPLVFAAFAAPPWFLFRRRSRVWRVLTGVNLAFFAGLIMLMAFRNFNFVDEQARCRAEAADVPAFVQSVAGPMHPYDFGGFAGDDMLGVAFGFESRFFRLLHDGPTLVPGAEIDRGVQRVTPLPGTRTAALPLWSQWGERERLLLVDLDTGARVGEAAVPGCRNLFEVEVVGDRLIALCEVSHSLHELDAAPPFAPGRSVVLPGMDSYDLAVDRERGRAYVTDWFSPYLVEVDLATFAVSRRKWIGFSSFGVALGPDQNVYVAQMFWRRVRVLDPETLSVVRTLKAGYGPRDLDFDPRRNLLLVGNYFDGTVDVFGLDDGRRVTRFFAGRLLRGLWYDAERDRLYLACGCGVRYVPLAAALAP